MKQPTVLALALSILLPTAAFAGPAADAVAYFYKKGIGTEAMEETRDRFTGAAKAFLDANDRIFDEREEICLDFGLAVDGQDYDEAEVARSLKLQETVDGEDRAVLVEECEVGLAGAGL